MKTGYLFIILALGVAGTGGGLDYLLNTPVNISTLVSANASGEQINLLDADAGITQSGLDNIEFSATLNRPLFNQDRRKFVKPPPPQPARKPPIVSSAAPIKPAQPPKSAQPKQPEPVLALLGISMSEGTSSALISQNGGKNIWVSSGDEINNWSIEDIGENHVRLKLGTRELKLLLYDIEEQ